ncbi:MAG TPA: hypothetical protein ENI95_05530 [Chloroflexi bacterium]|nr:hypothetical protein [Chloroflexota bacterium]
MSRVVKLNSPGKVRSQLMRTAAEVIRRLGQKSRMDEEARDMAALLVYCFRQIDRGIEDTVRAWEKRDYWIKAERFRRRWDWAGRAAADLEAIVRDGAWDELPTVLIGLLPHFEEIKIAKYTRNPSLWRGAYERFLREEAPPTSKEA